MIEVKKTCCSPAEAGRREWYLYEFIDSETNQKFQIKYEPAAADDSDPDVVTIIDNNLYVPVIYTEAIETIRDADEYIEELQKRLSKCDPNFEIDIRAKYLLSRIKFWQKQEEEAIPEEVLKDLPF